jgi:phytanoyl-CoA hydroxylase
MHDVQRQLHSDGYAIVRGFFDADEMRQIGLETDRIYQEGLKHHATYRHKNLLLEVLEDPKARRRVVIQAHWTAWISTYLESMRRHPKYFELLGPLLGPDIKQITHQLHWKPPGAKYTYYRYHQDAKFRNKSAVRNLLYGSINTGLAIDRQTVENGALRVVPRSHLHGNLGLSEDQTLMTGQTPDEDLVRVGLDPASIVTCTMEPGDLLLWTLGFSRRRVDSLRARARDLQIRRAAGKTGSLLHRAGLDRGSPSRACA